MQEIKCPKCGEVFQVDESGYAQIVAQVRDKEFASELAKRSQEMERSKESEMNLSRMEQEKLHAAEIEKKNRELNDKEREIERLVSSFGANDFAIRARMRVEALASKRRCCNLEIMSERYSHWNPVVFLHPEDGFVEGVDQTTNTYYYGVRNPDPEELIKEGHIFVQFINQIVKSPTANLAHGACVGMGGNGVLLCGTGHRGKSTLTVLAMLKGFEYVSDDYQILEQEDGQLYAWPFYSIITLSPTMYNEMYDDFKGKFVSMNARKDKYVFSIAPYHGQFRDRYPIRACLFPEIVNDPEPSIVPCTPQERSRAIAQLTGSTVRQMRDVHSPQTIKKLADMIKDYPFYKINLCRDIYRNVECLREFCYTIRH